MARQIQCPRCGKPTLFTPENKFRPFCSERCKLIDLGNWADGKYAVPVGPASESAVVEGSEELADADPSSFHDDDEPEPGSGGTNPSKH